MQAACIICLRAHRQKGMVCRACQKKFCNVRQEAGLAERIGCTLQDGHPGPHYHDCMIAGCHGKARK